MSATTGKTGNTCDIDIPPVVNPFRIASRFLGKMCLQIMLGNIYGNSGVNPFKKPYTTASTC